MPKAYLTIDDSPSTTSDKLINGLISRNIPALLYCRGDYLIDNPAPMVKAIQSGLVLANHGFTHTPASELGFKAVCEGILETEKLIDACYKQASRPRPGKYFRFPYIDRGDGDRLERRFFSLIEAANQGIIPNIEISAPVAALQEFLKAEGFTQPFKNITHPLYKVPAINEAYDCLFTYSTADWMLNARHKGTQPLQSLCDLTNALDADPYVLHEPGHQILLIHDQPEIINPVLSLLDHCQTRNIEFLEL